MVYGNAFTKLIWCNILFTLFCFSALKEVLLWQIDANGLQLNANYSVFPNSNNVSENAMSRSNGDQQINSALSEQLMNIAAAAGQPMPRFQWSPVVGQGGSKNAEGGKGLPLVQRTVRDSDSAAKVAAKQAELQQLLQQLYQAEATVQMEVGEVTRSQQIATEAEQMLEEATNKVRMLSSDLQAAQENAATCAMRAHTAQLQLAAHDQLMFTARQRVDALSAQMVSVQAELASVQNQFTLNESSQHLEQQGRINSIYQFQPGLTNNNQPDPAAAAAAAAAAANAGLLIVPPGQEQQANVYPVIRTPDQLNNQPQKK